MKQIRMVTRSSPLALYQSELVKQALIKHHLDVELYPMVTDGDKLLSGSLASIGGKGLFTKNLEEAILQGKADIAVHSAKDVPGDIREDFVVQSVFKRGNPFDLFISHHYKKPDDLKRQAIVGTVSLRRQSQFRANFPDTLIKPLRGNIDTRLKKLDQGEFDAIILAKAGVERLQKKLNYTYLFTMEQMLPAIGQGILCVQYLKDNHKMSDYLKSLTDDATELCLKAERLVGRYLGADCHSPISAYARVVGNHIQLRARVAKSDGSVVINARDYDLCSQVDSLAGRVCDSLLAEGAADYMTD